MSNKRLSSWCQSILPANYQQIKSQTEKFQRFLRDQLPDTIAGRIHVMNVSQTEIVVAVEDPQTTNYLRLHHREMQQQLLETFQCSQTLRFQTLPGDVLAPARRGNFRKPSRVSAENAGGIKRGAQWIEDDSLKQALESLSQRLNSADD
ncbi:MAG: DUF721 domain-containing protein [Gammaproteobacteria bacterium]|nr:DUF721 domain-containing protein [Gammaproteobacteria bacterium]